MPTEILTADADITDGDWLTDTGGTSLFVAIDEVTASDTDYVVSGAPDTDTCEIGLATPVATMTMPFSVAFRYKRIGSDTMTLRVQLMEGATQRASWDVSVSSSTFTDSEQFLTAPEFAAITDFSDLRVRLTAIRPPPYVGPGNVVSGAIRWWGLRAYSAANIGSNIIRLRRDSDNVEQDFAAISGGGLDLAAISTFKGAANLFVVKLYDQGTGIPSGGTNNREDIGQSSAGVQLEFILSGLGSLPIMRSDATYDSVETVSSTIQTQPLTMTAIAKRTSNFTTSGPVFTENANGNLLGFSNATNTGLIYNSGGFFTFTMSDSTWHSIIGVFNGGSSSANVDGSTTGGTVGGGGLAGNLRVPYDGSESLRGDVVEAGIWPIAMNSTQISDLNANQHAYWGF